MRGACCKHYGQGGGCLWGGGGVELLLERGHLLEETPYSPKWWWLVVDIYPSHEAAKK